ncbi:hypothetical protein BD626DRAFT_374257, partial [Schizophyllum amplum]
PPRQRARRSPGEREQLLKRLFPMPQMTPKDDFRYCEDPKERARLRALEQLAFELKAFVYLACDPREVRSDGDGYDPVIDYEFLRNRLSCHWAHDLSYDSDEEAEAWRREVPFDFAVQDALHAEIARSDVHMQEFIARGGDPKVKPYAGWVDID